MNRELQSSAALREDKAVHFEAWLDKFSTKWYNSRWTRFFLRIQGFILGLFDQPSSRKPVFKVNLARCDLMVEGQILTRPRSHREPDKAPRFIFSVRDQRTQRFLRLSAEKSVAEECIRVIEALRLAARGRALDKYATSAFTGSPSPAPRSPFQSRRRRTASSSPSSVSSHSEPPTAAVQAGGGQKESSSSSPPREQRRNLRKFQLVDGGGSSLGLLEFGILAVLLTVVSIVLIR